MPPASTAMVSVSEKRCTKCSEVKAATEFYKAPRNKDGLQSWCKPCHNGRMKEIAKENPDRHNARQRAWRAANPEKVKEARSRYTDENREDINDRKRAARPRRHGLTQEQFDALMHSQDGLCAVCKGPPDGRWKVLQIDHDHKCCPGEKSCGACVRGLLCARCNVVAGYMEDNPMLLQELASYLKHGRQF
jgi:Recombination endonuclease VII